MQGGIVDRIPLFDLNLVSASVEVSKRGILRIRDVGVTLNAVAADTLNAVFSVTAFYDGFPIGTANVITRVIGVHNSQGGDDNDDDDDDDD